MRTILASLVLALVLLAPAEARAQYPSYYYGSYYYPPVYTYPYVSAYTYPYGGSYTYPYVGANSFPYLWTARYYNTPYARGWKYQQYNPYTNQYFYRYRVRPNIWW